jgi:signal transduction histidine kinase
MSHEIRTPMNAIMGMTNILIEKNPVSHQSSYLEIIKKSAENLLVILNDILDLSKIEAGKIAIENVGFSPREVIDLVFQTLHLKAEEKGLVFSVEYSGEIPELLNGDPARPQPGDP